MWAPASEASRPARMGVLAPYLRTRFASKRTGAATAFSEVTCRPRVFSVVETKEQ